MKTNLIPIALTVIVAYSCSPYERSHIELRAQTRTNLKAERANTKEQVVLEIVQRVKDNYVDTFIYDLKRDTSIESIFQRLDPFSYYQSPNAAYMMKMHYGFAKRADLGITIDLVRDTPVINDIDPFTFAYNKGLLPGDMVMRVDSTLMIGRSEEDVENKLFAQYNSKRRIEVYRPSQQQSYMLQAEMTDVPEQKVVLSSMLSDSMGYLNITSFILSTTDQVKEGLDNLDKLGMKSLVIDLRRNSGGLLQQAIFVTDLFVHSDKPILSLRSSAHPKYNEVYYCRRSSRFENIPIILMVSERTASAGEVMAGILQDLDRATIVGTTTYGKALCQQPHELSNNRGEIILTTTRIHLPTGRCIQLPYHGDSQTYSPVVSYEDRDNSQHRFELGFMKFDTMKFITPSGRKMYGGVGIVPDYIVSEFSNIATNKLVADDSFFDNIRKFVREKHQFSYIAHPTPSRFYTEFPLSAAGKELERTIAELASLYLLDTGSIKYGEVLNYLTIYYSKKAHGIWAFTKEALLDDRQVQFALMLLQPKQEPSAKPVIKKVKKSKSVKRSAKS